MLDFEQASTLMKQWMERQTAAFAGMPNFDQLSAATKAAELWRTYVELWTTLSKVVPSQAGTSESATDLLMSQALGVPTGNAAEQAIGKMAQGPGFATLWDWDRKSLRVYSAWLELQQATSAYRALFDQAWQEAYQRFVAEFAKPASAGKPPVKTWREGMELWFSTANLCLVEAQRSEEFLAAQRRQLRAATNYRLGLRDLGEELSETFQIPGRGEMDELARLVHQLRREVRELRRRNGTARKARAGAVKTKA